MFYMYLNSIPSHNSLIIACLKITLQIEDMIYCCYQSFLDLNSLNLTSGRNGIYAKKFVLVLMIPSNIIINHVAVKFTVIWFPMNKFTQPALL